MKKSSRPVIGGILTLLSAALAIFGAMNYAVGYIDRPGFGKGDIPPFVPSIIFGVPLMSIVIGVLALAGGILAMRRKRWKWALAGAIAGALSLLPLGIAAIVLIAISREEFA
jgi:hypothetical protein